MPTYEYRCKSCEHEFEIVQAFTDDALTECPECAGPLKKVFGNVGITFKGSGFYKTDSRSAGSFGSAKDADRSDKGSSTKAGSSGSGTADKGSGSTTSTDKGSGSSSGSSGNGSGSSGSGSGSSGTATSRIPHHGEKAPHGW